MPDPSSVAALIFAAGFSTRMGAGHKLFLPLGRSDAPEDNALDFLARLYGEAGVDLITLVGGQLRGEELTGEATRLGFRYVENPEAGRGMFSSVCAGLRAIALSGAAHCFLHPADIPLVRPCTLHILLREAREDPNTVLIPTFRGEEGHPPLLPAAHIPAVLAWPGERGLRGALEKLPKRLIPVPDGHILLDMDTDEDYAKLCVQAARRHILEPLEAEELLRCRGVPANILAHVRAVSRVAAEFARAKGLDPLLAETGALLHDMCRMEKKHGQAAARELRALSLPRLAVLVEEHTDCILADDAPFTEKELVYLADKYVHGDCPLSLRERYGQQKKKFSDSPEAQAAVAARLARAEAMERRLAGELGLPPYELARRALAAP